MYKLLFLHCKSGIKAGAVFLLLFLISGQAKLFAQADSLIFKDDFNRDSLGPNWQAYDTWSVTDGAAHNYIDGTGGILRTTQHFASTSYVLETAAKGFTNSYWREFRITFGQTSLASDSAYVLSYKPHLGGQLTLSRATDNIYAPEPLDEMIIYPDLSSEQWYTFKIVKYKSGLIQVFLDQGEGYSDTPLVEAIDTAYRQLGHFGWQEDTQTAAEDFYVDWIEARIPAVEKPAVKEKPAEDDLITQVSAASGASYTVAKLNVGVEAYTDRGYTFTSVPAYLCDASFVQPAMDDKADTSSSFLTMFIKKDAIIYIGYDSRAKSIPAWLKSWTKTGDIIETTDPASKHLEVYRKLISYGQVYPEPLLLGGNMQRPAAGAQMNYLVIAVEKPATVRLEAEEAKLSGAIVASNHGGYSGAGFVDYLNPFDDYIEWTVQTDIPGYYGFGFNFSNGLEYSRPLVISIDGDSADTSPFYSTYNWESWGTYQGPKVYLTRGTHTIRATAAGLSGPNIDYLSVYYTVDPPINTPIAVSYAHKGFTGLTGESGNFPVAYPNPFGGSTTISYNLPERQPVQLTVYTMTGQRVAVLVDETQEAGAYNVPFQAQSLQSGLYIYRLETGKHLNTGKILKQ